MPEVVVVGKNGSDILITIGGMVVGSQRDATIDESSDVIDISSKESRARRILPGRYSSTLSLDALYVPDSVSYTAIKTAMREGTLVNVAVMDNNINIKSASGYVTSLSEEYPDQGEATVSITIEIDGEWTELTGGT